MSINIHNILKYVLVAAVVAFISLLFPVGHVINNEYSPGDTWEQETLTASFDFPIPKSPDVLQEERDKIREEFYPVFRRYPSKLDEAQNEFSELLNDQFSGIERDTGNASVASYNAYERVGNRVLQEIYETGILGSTYPQEWDKPYIQVLTDKKLRLTDKSDFLSMDEATAMAREAVYGASLEDQGMLLTLVLESLEPNIQFDAESNERFLNQALSDVQANSGKVSKGDVIIEEGDVVTKEIDRILRAYDEHYTEEVGLDRTQQWAFAGYLLLTILVIGVFLVFLKNNYNDVFKRYRGLIFMLIWPMIFSSLVYVIEDTSNISTYIIPFCIVPIIVKHFYNDSLALYLHLVIVVISSFLSNLGYEFTVLQLMAGIVAVISVKEIRIWSEFFSSVFYIVLVYVGGHIGLALIAGEPLPLKDLVWFLVNGILTLLAYPLIPLLERIFGFVSSIKLTELNDLNHPLLKDLSVQCPGTLQHSLQVSNLAESAAKEIGANALLVKVGALYHDIGKMVGPEYFIENQSGENPHEQLDELESAKKIISHVPEGARMARKQNMPKILVDFILTHHGTTRVEYFYRKFKQKHPDRAFDESLFRYPGPKPSTKEEAILMLADSIEAASKSLKNPTGKDIDELVDKITDHKVEQHQLDESSLTFAEMVKSKNVFKKMLRSIYHVRIEYPEAAE